AVAQHLAELGALQGDPAGALALNKNPFQTAVGQMTEFLGAERGTFASAMLDAVSKKRLALWQEQIDRKINWELFDRGVEAFTWAALEELGRSAKGRGLLGGAPHGAECARFAEQAQRARNGKEYDGQALKPFLALRQELEKP